MQFKLDENVPDALAALLAGAGHDVHTAAHELLQGAKDPQILSACTREARALITFDLDFADIRAYPPAEHSGLIVLRLRSQAARYLIQVFTQVLPLLNTEPIQGHLWLVEDHQIRIR